MTKKHWLAAAILAAACLILPRFAAGWVLSEVRQRLDLEISGRMGPSLIKPEFVIRGVELTWKDKIKIVDGTLAVSYPPLFFLNPGRIRLKLTGSDLKAKLLGSWSELQGVDRATIERADVDIDLGPDGIREIYRVNVISPEFQFQIKQSETLAQRKSDREA